MKQSEEWKSVFKDNSILDRNKRSLEDEWGTWGEQEIVGLFWRY